MDEFLGIITLVVGIIIGFMIVTLGNNNIQFSRQEALKYKIGYYSTTTGAFELNEEFKK